MDDKFRNFAVTLWLSIIKLCLTTVECRTLFEIKLGSYELVTYYSIEHFPSCTRHMKTQRLGQSENSRR